MLKPQITEKTTALARDQNKYTFLVDVGMTKKEIKAVIAKTFGVSVKGIATVNIHGKVKRFGKARKEIRLPNIKKASVLLPEKEKISLFEIEEKKAKSNK